MTVSTGKSVRKPEKDDNEVKELTDGQIKLIKLLIKLYHLKKKRLCRIITYFIIIFLLLFPIVSLILILNDGAILSDNSEYEGYFGTSHKMLEIVNKLKRLLEKNIYIKSAQNEECARMPKELRFDCHPDNGASMIACQNRGCCWDPPNENIKSVPLSIPYCFYPTSWKLYEYENYTRKNSGFTGYLINKRSSFLKDDLPILKMEAINIDENILEVKIYDPTKLRYEPKWPVRKHYKPFGQKMESTNYRFQMDNSKPGFRIWRSNNQKSVVFDSLTAGGFIFSNQFLQMSTLLSSSHIYGLGEHRNNLKLNTTWQTLTLFNRDQAPIEHSNLYGSHPFYLVVEQTGDCYGVLFLNSNAMDIILQPTPALTFRSTGGIFDLYFFMGPTPADVLAQYTQIVGKPFMPPYWSLGFHLCRFGYRSLEKTKEVWNRTRAAGIPFDTQWNDLDYMSNNNNFIYDKNKFKDLPKFVKELHKIGMHYIPLIDPGISASEEKGTYPPYDDGIKNDIFIKNSETNLPFVGKVWNRVSTVWPDFTHPKSQEYWYNMMNSMHENFQYDGAWIDMNEPSNFFNGLINGCSPSSLMDNPPYTPNVAGEVLYSKTLCMNAKHYLGWHYDIHNTYGIAEAAVTHFALEKIRNKRPFIVSRATWVGQGSYSAHWTGDVFSTWHDLRMSVPEILAFSIFQIPMVGADICGFNGNTTQDLCNRWMQLGAFYPFSRNHNTDDAIDQDPVAMGDIVVKSSRKALMIRYRFLPYLYTLFFKAHMFGEAVARPLFFEFVKDPNTLDVDSQFLWGKAMMFAPVLEKDKEEVTAYLPSGLWFDFYNKSFVISKGQNFTLPAPVDTIPILIRGGNILPAQTPGKTTTESRQNKFELLIAPDLQEKAVGELFWDDGDSIDSIESGKYILLKFSMENKTIKSQIQHDDFDGKMILGKIQIMGFQSDVTQVTINNTNVPFSHDKKRNYLTVKPIQVDLKYSFIMQWK
ncbi:lysosomal alpha-glucosidase-like [Chelonus insularis]|uniref:lysosomal alpha-glucosidase-like n=1 Tax=Chelonus insularis TaxID=460826 RepID=UPI00158E4F31|nr:lysosomal alpha-glucosidase-like [Chelonus insularis]XP_034941550.1 lysosomal alpha-glucosidase-like [Chelonus insularis]XP_034941551.1 lysosomal alpha-glucosidase-like [Chelonus insularis]XP_034941552.1 lysosomal alpha-glucosidase-like [Chelonus insularis]